MIITIGRKPFDTTVCDNLITEGCGAINIKETRLDTQAKSFLDKGREANGTSYNWANTTRGEMMYDGSAGRFPSNFILSESIVEILDQQSGELRARGNKGCSKGGGGMFGHAETVNNFGFGDKGGASRFFKVVK